LESLARSLLIGWKAYILQVILRQLLLMKRRTKMLDIKTLKAGDVVRRLNSDSFWFKEGDVCTVQLDSKNLLCIYTTTGRINYSIVVYPRNWELLNERTPTLEESLQEAVDANFQEAFGQNSKAVKHLPMLLDYLKQHSIVASFNSVSGMLECEAVYSDNGKALTVVEEVEPTLKGVREWLGY
jgi:hypothetical protein